jgi:glucose/arabinose dehydrogenase
VAGKPYADLRRFVSAGGERGLLSVAFHPKFATNGRLYVYFTDRQGNEAIWELRAAKGAASVKSGHRVLMTIEDPEGNHNGGQLQFGPDGMLYVGMGDGGSQHDPSNNGQRTDTLLAKMLRIDVTPRERYAIPKDNPFVGVAGARPEIWAIGLRNPWRFSFDRETGLLYAGDVGQDQWEEVNVIEKGGNYGWRVREGTDDLHPVDKPPKIIDPVFEYSHNGTAASITGGSVYRGKKIPSLRGWYLCGDYSTGRIYGVKYENGKTVAAGVLIDPHDRARSYGLRATQPSAFGEDADGEMFLCDVNGPVYRIVAAEPTDAATR